ncbi:MAG: hypothetical protein HDR00_02985 [Lachnospiraceae bacterium]|nr:hypothetical protein [Lachnospiraceae bacterium]
MKKSKKIMVAVLALALMLGMNLVVYASATALLYSNETTKTTACVGNSNECFYWWGNVGSTSEYPVEFIMYGGKNSANCSMVLKRKTVSIGGSFSPVKVSASSSSFSVGKVTMCGNNSSNLKTQCIAGAGISSTN